MSSYINNKGRSSFAERVEDKAEGSPDEKIFIAMHVSI